MSANQRISQVFQQAHQIPFDDDSRFVLFSDCHRGDNSWADDFASNQSLLFRALEHYYAEGFSYIEVGDGDELWENSKFGDIRQAHSNIFWVMRKFHENQRLFLIYGNHDMERSDPKIVDETLQYYYDERTGQVQPLFVNIKVYEGIILKHVVNERQLFILHGHQADPFNDRYWKIGRFTARHFWRHLQLLGVKEPTSPAKNFKKRVQIENTLNDWVKLSGQMLIAGHTHRPRIPAPGQPLYFNSGSCIHPRGITGLEIVNSQISLIKWWMTSGAGGAVYIKRQELAGPISIESYYVQG